MKSNAEQVAAAWAARADAAGRELRNATKKVVAMIYQESRKNMKEMIYDKPVPKRASGKPMWTRTGNLRRSERFVINSPLEGMVYNNAASQTKKGKTSKYAKPRHDMVCRFPAPWRTTAVAKVQPQIRKIYKNAIRAAIRTGRLSDLGGGID